MHFSLVEIVGLIAIPSAALLFMWLERRYPYNPGQKLFRDGFWLDMLWYNFVQSYVLALIIAQLIRFIDSQSGISRLHLISDWPIWLQLIFFIVTHDIYIYLFHRWQHANPYLWRLHEAHHSVHGVDWLSGVRSHPLEILINQTIEYAPILLLGAAPEVAILKGTIGSIWGMFIHSNLNVRLGRWQYFINGPEMHRWHHADDLRVYHKNFATKFAIWDWLGGTAFYPREEKAQIYGLPYDYFPNGYWNQTFYAFRSEDPVRLTHSS